MPMGSCQADIKETGRAAAYFALATANGKCNVGNAVVERSRSFRRLARNPCW